MNNQVIGTNATEPILSTTVSNQIQKNETLKTVSISDNDIIELSTILRTLYQTSSLKLAQTASMQIIPSNATNANELMLSTLSFTTSFLNSLEIRNNTPAIMITTSEATTTPSKQLT
jgi:hypothetical protein